MRKALGQLLPALDHLVAHLIGHAGLPVRCTCTFAVLVVPPDHPCHAISPTYQSIASPLISIVARPNSSANVVEGGGSREQRPDPSIGRQSPASDDGLRTWPSSSILQGAGLEVVRSLRIHASLLA